MAYVNRVFPAARKSFLCQDSYMPSVSLSQLHACKLEVRFTINELNQRFRGVGTYESDAKLGKVLRIDVDDDSGGFSLLLQEGKSTCDIRAACEADLDYHVHL